MTKRDISALLPEKAPENFKNAVFCEFNDSLGGNFLVFSRVPYYSRLLEWGRIMSPENVEAYERSGRHTWVAECTCTACGSVWLSSWVGGGEILMYQIDGCCYPGFPELGETGTIFVGEGDEAICPYCDSVIYGIKKSKLKGGRTYQALVCHVESVWDGALSKPNTILMYWLARRRVTPKGSKDDILPAFAVAIGEKGNLTLYSHCKRSYAGRVTPAEKWEQRTQVRDPALYSYYSYDSAFHNTKGAYVWESDIPDMAGETGEKTGLREYISAGGIFPAQYLAAWEKNRTLENVVKTGLGKIVVECIDKEAEHAMEYNCTLFGPAGLDTLFDWSSPRPCDMVGMIPALYRKIPKWDWKMETLQLWREARALGLALPTDAELFNNFLLKYGFANVNMFIGKATDGWDYTMTRIDRYLNRQNSKYGLPFTTGARMLFDYHTWLYEDHAAEVTPEEEYPNNLRYAHDMLSEKRKIGDAKKYAKEFAATFKKWRALEWTDGELCTVLPQNNSDLVAEGRVLHHCVGGYGKEHITGKLIIFVRHYRRPERSYFTLNIDTTGKSPREIQFHGYGNEYAHGKRLMIPHSVREFVDCWEQEILPDVFRKVKAQEERVKKQQKTKEVAA